MILLDFFLIATATAVVFGAGFFLGYVFAWDLGRTLLQRQIQEEKKHDGH